MNILEINKILMQRYPMQMLDRVLEIIPGVYAKGKKNVTINENYFSGHFPGFPIMPGVMVIETAAQLCTIIMAGGDAKEDLIPVILKIDNMKFVKAVLPGDTLMIEATKTEELGEISKFSMKAYIDGTKAASGELSFIKVKKESLLGEKENF